MALRRAPALFGNIRSMSKVARAPITFRPRPGTVIPENAISKEMYDDLAHHGGKVFVDIVLRRAGIE